MNAETVNPQKWSDKRILFDDGEISVIPGRYESGDLVLGMRWNGVNDEVGYPNYAGNPTWFVYPNNFSLSLIRDIIGKLKTIETEISRKYLENCLEVERYFL